MPITPLVRPAPPSAWMVLGSIMTTVQPSAISWFSAGWPPSTSSAGAVNGAGVIGCQAGWALNTASSDGSRAAISVFIAALMRASSSGEGGAGAGKVSSPRWNMTRAGIGSLFRSGLITIIGMSSVMAGSLELSTWPTRRVATIGVKLIRS